MKWTLERWIGFQFEFGTEEGHELRVFAKTLEDAVRKARMVLSSKAEIDVSGWEEED